MLLWLLCVAVGVFDMYDPDHEWFYLKGIVPYSDSHLYPPPYYWRVYGIQELIWIYR